MKRRLKRVLGVGLAFMLVASLMAFAVPVAAADYTENDWGEWGLAAIEPGTDVGPMAIAPDGTIFAAIDEPAVLKTTGDVGTGNEARIVVPLPAGTTLNSITSISWFTYLVSGYVPHCDFVLDKDGDGMRDDVLVAEGAYQNGDSTAGWSTTTWIETFEGADGAYPSWSGISGSQTASEVKSVQDKTAVWLWTSGQASIDTLSAYKAGNAVGTVDEDTVVLALEIEVDNWVLQSEALVRQVSVNGIPVGGTSLVKSEDDGYTWDDTELDPAIAPIVDIAVSPNYDDDEIVYVGCLDGTVYRLEEAGEGDVIALKEMVASDSDVVSALYSIDTWYDGDYNWILAATNEDVFVIKDRVFEDWRDQELGDDKMAYEVAFAPDFDDSELIWAIVQSSDGEFLITSTVSPGKWGQEVGDVEINIDATPWVDLGFPDNYDSDPDTGDTIVFAALSDGSDGGEVYLIEGVDADDGDSNAIGLFDLAGDPSVDIISLAVSGDYPDSVVLAGALRSPTVHISDDGGDSWDTVDKSPTGESFTHVYMEADVVWGGEVFDTDEGMAFASTFGDESAVSRANDGGQVYNQVGLIDTEIDEIIDLGFHPDFPGEPTFLMLTEDTDYATYSVWLTENGDEEEPDYIRLICAYDGPPGNLEANSLGLVDWSWDGDAIYLYGDEDDVESIWKSTNDGQTFGKQRSVKGGVQINDWEIPFEDTIYAATTGAGFAMTTNSGLSWSATTVGSAMNDIALQPGFDADDADMDNILMGSFTGDVFVSLNGGDTFKDTGADSYLDGNVYVAFDAEYADEDADGETLIYACDDSDNKIQVGEEDGVDTEWDPLEDETNKDNTSFVLGDFYGLVVSEDNALYAIANTCIYDSGDNTGDWTATTGVARLLLHESNSLWEIEGATDLTDPVGLWLTPGSNVLWTVNDITLNELWVLEDTCSGAVTLSSPADGYRSEAEEDMRVAWKEVRDAEEYQVKYTHVDTGTANTVQPDDTDVLLTELFSTSEYDWKVRVAPAEPWHSRWSGTWSFHTALGPPPWSPTLYTPGGEWQYSGIDVDLMPAFSWESAKTADGYQFVLADNAELASPLVNKKVSSSAYQLDFELEYNSNYFWKVMAYKGTKAISRWSDIGAFTTLEKAVAPPAPAPPATVTQPAPGPIVIPTPIPPALLWTIIGIGALLIIAVIVLIVRTRRVV